MSELAEVSKHVALTLNDEHYSFWPEVARIDDSKGPAPARVNKDSKLEYITLYVRENALDYMYEKNMRLPSGSFTHSILFEQCQAIIVEQEEAKLVNYFSGISIWSVYLGNQQQEVLQASTELAKWLRTRAKKYSSSSELIDAFADAVSAASIVDLRFLDAAAMFDRCKTLSDASELSWYAKVGAKTDRYSNSGQSLNFAKLFLPAETAGLQYFRKGLLRHNCASFILDILSGWLRSKHSLCIVIFSQAI